MEKLPEDQLVTITLPKKLCRDLIEVYDWSAENDVYGTCSLIVKLLQTALKKDGIRLDNPALNAFGPVHDYENGSSFDDDAVPIMRAVYQELDKLDSK